MYTQRAFKRTHGDVFDAYTFPPSHTHTPNTHRHTHTTHAHHPLPYLGRQRSSRTPSRPCYTGTGSGRSRPQGELGASCSDMENTSLTIVSEPPPPTHPLTTHLPPPPLHPNPPPPSPPPPPSRHPSGHPPRPHPPTHHFFLDPHLPHFFHFSHFSFFFLFFSCFFLHFLFVSFFKHFCFFISLKVLSFRGFSHAILEISWSS